MLKLSRFDLPDVPLSGLNEDDEVIGISLESGLAAVTYLSNVLYKMESSRAGRPPTSTREIEDETKRVPTGDPSRPGRSEISGVNARRSDDSIEVAMYPAVGERSRLPPELSLAP